MTGESLAGGGPVQFVAWGVSAGLAQILLALVGAALISAAVQGFKAEWQALFKKNFGGAAARILVYVLCAGFQAWNGRVHNIPTAEIPVLAILTAFAATGIYHFARKRLPA